MRIAQIVPSLEARHGGPTRSVRGLSDGLARAGHAVELLTTGPLDAATTKDSGSLAIRAFPRAWPEALARSAGLARHLGTGAHDVIHHHGLWQRTLHYAHRRATASSVPLVISPRGMMTAWAWNHRRWKKRLAAWCVHPGAFAAASGWHATSEAEADDIRRLGFTQPVCVAPNGVIPPSSDDEAAAAAHWRKTLPQLAGRRVALFYSRFHSKKRVLELIDLWLSAPREDWMLLMVGIAEQYTAHDLDAYVIRAGGVGRVVVHDGTHAPAPYAISSLFLLPSHSENFGLVVAEALVRGVPVLTTDATPWQELSARGAGLCVSWSEYGPALDALLASTPSQLRVSGERARAWVAASFSWSQTASTLATFYSRLRRSE